MRVILAYNGTTHMAMNHMPRDMAIRKVDQLLVKAKLVVKEQRRVKKHKQY